MLKLTILVFLLLKSVNLSDITYYEILGISKQATTQEIRQAFKKLAIKYHPDKNPDEEAQEKFLKINEAYETLKDPDKRHNYDVYGSYSSRSGQTRMYDYRSQGEYNNLYYNGLYHDDPFVDTLSGGGFAAYLNEGFHFINFYSPFCPPCQKLVEHWKKLAEIYKGIIKIAAVNCKHHNSFCYNSMRINSYPSLLFYPNGKNGNFIYYRGDRTFDALEKFVLSYLNSRTHVPTVAQIRSTQTPFAYVLGRNRIDDNALTRISYRLKDLVSLVIVEDDSLRDKLTSDEYVTIVFRYKNINKEILSAEEKEILKEIVEALPTVDVIEPEDLKEIRRKLRSGYQHPWVLYFSNKDSDKLLLHQIKIAYPDMQVGEIDCDEWVHLCASLHVDEAPAWGLLKPGGAYQLVPDNVDVKSFIQSAAEAVKLHTLSAAELNRILDGDTSTWVLLVVPHQLQWDHIVGPFTEASMQFKDLDDIHFGIMACTMNTESYCRRVANRSPAIVVQERETRHYFSGRHNSMELVQFINLIRNSAEMELSEERMMEIMDFSSRDDTWLVAFLPAHCGQVCDQLLHQWRIVAEKLKPLEFVRVGYLKCSTFEGLCRNIKSPTMRLYPLSSGHHYTTSMQQLSQAPYMLEWALLYIDDSVIKLNWQSFSRNVISEELNPTSTKKPWLVYFHSPRCYRCYEMYADFAIAGILLGNNIQLGKVNCVTDHNVCQHEQITSYPSLKLYLHRNQHNSFSRVISIPVKDYASLLRDVKPYLNTYELPELRNHGFKVKHDEF